EQGRRVISGDGLGARHRVRGRLGRVLHERLEHLRVVEVVEVLLLLGGGQGLEVAQSLSRPRLVGGGQVADVRGRGGGLAAAGDVRVGARCADRPRHDGGGPQDGYGFRDSAAGGAVLHGYSVFGT